MRIGGLLLAAIFTACAGRPAPVAAAVPDLQTRLLAGEVVALEVDEPPAGGKHGGAARMQVLVQAPARDVWAVIVSCELAYRFIDGLRSCEVLEQSAGRALVHQVVDQGWLMPRFDFVFESRRRPYEWIGVSLVKGNLDSMEGSWRFEETAAGTLVEHQLRLRPAAPVPRFLVRRNLRRSMPDLLACVRALANGSATDAQRHSDLARCQH
ncbi:MAG: SRPBCC family protein [Xanthomonadales bacterium]|nr:SRPBCC family protein [Xanthomonadales bacterium]